MRAAAALMRTRRDEVAAWEIVECGKAVAGSGCGSRESDRLSGILCGRLAQARFPKTVRTGTGELNQRLYSPRGVTAVIAPWNFPLAIPTGMVSAALVTGNPVIFKPSERSPMMGHWRRRRSCGRSVCPEGVLCCLPGGPDIGRALGAILRSATIAFTGSKDVGLGILKEPPYSYAGAKHGQAGTGRDGRKKRIIVDGTADLDDAITGVSHRSLAMRDEMFRCSRAIRSRGDLR